MLNHTSTSQTINKTLGIANDKFTEHISTMAGASFNLKLIRKNSRRTVAGSTGKLKSLKVNSTRLRISCQKSL